MIEVDRDEWIRRIVPGRTFADVGGLWNTVNEKVSVAAAADATSLTMIDLQQPGNVWWERFDERMQELDVIDYQCVVADASSERFAEVVGQFDVVYCSGVLYHFPSPYTLIQNLRLISREYVVLTSMTIPSVISNEAGRITVPEGQALFLPAITGDQRRILRRHFEALSINPTTILDVPDRGWLHRNGVPDFGPWWWLMTEDFIKGLARAAQFEVLESGEVWGGRVTDLLLRKLPLASPGEV